MEYHWPGNLRELRIFVIRTLILRDQESACAYLQSKTQSQNTALVLGAPTDMTDKKTMNPAGMKNAISEIKNQTEIRILQDALSASGWNRRKAATNLNISYRSIRFDVPGDVLAMAIPDIWLPYRQYSDHSHGNEGARFPRYQESCQQRP
jgi:two-component system response regulator AtoC